MTSTPISSSSSATSSFSSKVMVAPGHCSPSRSVVSKMMTRSLVGLVRGGHCKFPFELSRRQLAGRFEVSGDLDQPLSAQARAPSRPSGAAKKELANKKSGQRRGRDRGGGQSHLPRNPIDLAANQHCQTLLSPKSSVKTVDGWLPGGSVRPFLDEKWQQLQRQKMVRGADLVAGPCPGRAAACNAAAQSRDPERHGIWRDGPRASAAHRRRGAALRPGHGERSVAHKSFLLVIASAAKQSRLPPRRDSGLLRCARNDEV